MFPELILVFFSLVEVHLLNVNVMDWLYFRWPKLAEQPKRLPTHTQTHENGFLKLKCRIGGVCYVNVACAIFRLFVYVLFLNESLFLRKERGAKCGILLWCSMLDSEREISHQSNPSMFFSDRVSVHSYIRRADSRCLTIFYFPRTTPPENLKPWHRFHLGMWGRCGLGSVTKVWVYPYDKTVYYTSFLYLAHLKYV